MKQLKVAVLVLAVVSGVAAFFVPTEAKGLLLQREVLESWGYVVGGVPQCTGGTGAKVVVGAEIWDECSQSGCSWGVQCAQQTQRFEACKIGCP